MGSLSSTVVTSYWLPILTTGLSLTVHCSELSLTDGRTDGQTELV